MGVVVCAINLPWFGCVRTSDHNDRDANDKAPAESIAVFRKLRRGTISN